MRVRAALPQPERFTFIQAAGALVSMVLVGAVLWSLVGSSGSVRPTSAAPHAGTQIRLVSTTGAHANGVAPVAAASGAVAGATTLRSAHTANLSPLVGASAAPVAAAASSSTNATVASSHGGAGTATSRGVSAVVTANDPTGIVEAAHASLTAGGDSTASSSAAFTPVASVGGGALQSAADSAPASHASGTTGQSGASVTTTDTTTTTTSTSTSDSSGTAATLPSLPAGSDGAWIVPPIPGGLDPAGNPLPDVPGIATGPAPAGDVLAMGNPGDQFAFDVSTRTWILAPDSGVGYKPGVGYISMGSGSSSSSTSGAADPASALPDGLAIDPSVPAGRDGSWIVPPVKGALDPAGNPLPDLPGIAVGPAPAGDVLAMGPPGDEFAFDVSTRTWILAPTGGVNYLPGVGYVSAP